MKKRMIQSVSWGLGVPELNTVSTERKTRLKRKMSLKGKKSMERKIKE